MTKASKEALKLSLSAACHRQLPKLATLGVPLCSLECLMRVAEQERYHLRMMWL